MAQLPATITGSLSRKPCLPGIMKWTPDETLMLLWSDCVCVLYRMPVYGCAKKELGNARNSVLTNTDLERVLLKEFFNYEFLFFFYFFLHMTFDICDFNLNLLC